MKAIATLCMGAALFLAPLLSSARAAGPGLQFRQQPSAFNFVDLPFSQAPLLEILGADGSVDIAGEDCVITLTLEAKAPVRLRGKRRETSRGGVVDFANHQLRVSGVKTDDSFRLIAEGSGSARCRALRTFSDYFVVSVSSS